MRFFRLLRIVSTIGRHGLDEFLVGRGLGIVRLAFRAAFFWADRSGPRGVRLRLALQELGPIFVKFGQALSTRVLFTLSAGGFTLASIGCGFAWSLESLIVMRAVQGFLGGAMIPLVFSTSITAFPRSRAMQLSAGMGLIVTMAPTVGPTLTYAR